MAVEANPGLIAISTVALVCAERCLLWIWVMIKMDLAFLLALHWPAFVSDESHPFLLECNLE